VIYDRRKSERTQNPRDKQLKWALGRDPSAKDKTYLELGELALRDAEHAPASARLTAIEPLGRLLRTLADIFHR
jgi:hypothetical protein